MATQYDASPIRINLVSDLMIDEFSGATPTRMSSYMQNATVGKYPIGSGDQRLFSTQRPSIELLEDASDTTADARGRGIYYWASNDHLYFINNDTVYVGSHTNSIGTITAGTEKCYFFEVGVHLALVDPENNELWYIDTADTLTQVSDPDLPTTICHGGAELDGYFFIMDEDGVIWQSDFEDVTSWNALNFIEAARENDGGTYLTKLDNHIIAFGSRSIEFFYNAENPTASILSRRPDIFFNIGCGQPMAVVENGLDVKFVGKTRQGAIAVYQLAKFQLTKISSNSIEAWLTDAITQAGISAMAAGMYANGTNYYLLTLYDTPSDISDFYTIVYNDAGKIWGVWNSALTEFSAFTGLPLIGWSIASVNYSQFGYGQMINGDRMTIRTNFQPIDAYNSQYYIVDQNDYVFTDYVEVYGGSGDNIPMIVRVGQNDEGMNDNKFIYSLEWVGDYTDASQTITVRWSDEDDDGFNTGKSLDISDRRKLLRLGKANRRTYQIEYSGNEIIRGEALETKIRGGMS